MGGLVFWDDVVKDVFGEMCLGEGVMFWYSVMELILMDEVELMGWVDEVEMYGFVWIIDRFVWLGWSEVKFIVELGLRNRVS